MKQLSSPHLKPVSCIFLLPGYRRGNSCSFFSFASYFSIHPTQSGKVTKQIGPNPRHRLKHLTGDMRHCKLNSVYPPLSCFSISFVNVVGQASWLGWLSPSILHLGRMFQHWDSEEEEIDPYLHAPARVLVPIGTILSLLLPWRLQ